MWDFSVLLAMRAVEASMGVTIHRFLAILKSASIFLAALIFGAGTGFAIGAKASMPEVFATVGGLLGMMVGGWLLSRSKQYRLFAVQGTTIAALTAIIEGQLLPASKAQTVHAQKIIENHFQDREHMHPLYCKIICTLTDMTMSFSPISDRLSALPRPGLVRKITSLMLRALFPHWGGAILAQCLREKETDMQQSSRNSLALFAQNYDRMWKNAWWLTGFVLLSWVVLFCLIWVPLGWAIESLPSQVNIFWQIVFTLVFSWILKVAYFDAVALHAMIQVYIRITDGQSADAEWVNKLEQCSYCYKEIEQLDGVE